MQQAPIHSLLESLVECGTSREFSDAGIVRLLSIYRTHDIQPPVTLLMEAEWRGVTIPPPKEKT